MLERLKKHLGIEDAPAADLNSIQTQLTELQSQFEGVQSNLADAVSTITSLTAEKDGLEAALADAIETNKILQEQLAATAAKAVEAKDQARKAKLVAVIGTEKAETTFEAVKGLEDGAFDAVLAAMATSVEKEAQTELFKETGVAGDAEPAKEMTAEEKILRDKYKK